MARRSHDYFRCPQCNGEVRVGAAACPHCGSDDETGWSEDADVEEDDFDYDEYVAREFPDDRQPFQRTRGVNRFWQAVAIVVLLLIAWSFIRR
jgi:hypothetical protein